MPLTDTLTPSARIPQIMLKTNINTSAVKNPDVGVKNARIGLHVETINNLNCSCDTDMITAF